MKNNGYIKASSSDVQKENSVRALKNLSTKSTNRLAMKKDTKVVNGLLYIASDKTVSLNLRNIAKDALRNLSPTGNDAWEKAEVRNTLLLVLSDEASTPKDKENSLRALGFITPTSSFIETSEMARPETFEVLRHLAESGTDNEKNYAKKILPRLRAFIPDDMKNTWCVESLIKNAISNR